MMGESLGSLRAAFQSGTLSPVTVMARCLAEIRQHGFDLGIVNHLVDEEELFSQAGEASARWQTGNPLSDLDGIPFGVKANIAIGGLPWTAGIAAYRHRIADQDAAVVAMMKAAGMIPVATLNMHEAALGATSDNPRFLRTVNPHDPQRIPGGSSGGSAAVVAAGLLPIALGTDDLGSVRLPSAFCGVVGFKPSFGLIPIEGVVPLSPSLDHVGIHAQSTTDIAAVMTLFGTGRRRCSKGMGYWETTVALHQDVALVLNSVLQKIDPVDRLSWADVDLSEVRRAGLLRCELDAARVHQEMLDHRPEGFSREFHADVNWALRQTAEKTSHAEALIERTVVRLRDDVRNSILLGATAPCPAPGFDDSLPTNIADLTGPAALAGLPAISIPGPSKGLPVGLQLVGETDSHLLDCAIRLEEQLV